MAPLTDFSAIFELAKKHRRTLAVVSVEKPALVEATGEAQKEGLAEPIFIGDEKVVKKLTDEVFPKGKSPQIIHQADHALAVKTACDLVKAGKAQAVMKGDLSTAVFMKGILDKETGLNTGRLLSHIAVLSIPTYPKLMFITDGGLNLFPDLATKVNIVQSAIECAHRLGYDNPKVACLAGVETVDEKQPDTMDAAVLVEMNIRGQISGAVIDGPLAFDLAVSKESAREKKVVSPVAGDADIFLVHTMFSGNILAKGLMYLGGAKAAGIVVGAQAPIILLSRADDAETKLRSIALGMAVGC
jgi:phosphate butyryltransferase